MTNRTHTPGPFIVRGESLTDPADAMGAEPRDGEGGGWPYFIREDREFPLGSGPLWLAHGIQRIEDARLFAAAPALLAALRTAESAIAGTLDARGYRDGDDLDTWAHIVRNEVAALATIRTAIAAAEGRS